MSQDQYLSDILTPSGFIILNLGEISNFIEHKYRNYLQEPAAGIYKVGERSPAVYNGQFCFVKDITNDQYRVPLINFDSLNENNYLVNEKDTVLIDNFYVKNKNNMLSNIPTVPTVGYNFVKQIVNYRISSKNLFTKESNNVLVSMFKFLKPNEDQLGITNGIISEEFFDSLYKQIDLFVCKDFSHVYFYKPIGICDLIVEKTIDWRAYQWHLNQEETKNERHHF